MNTPFYFASRAQCEVFAAVQAERDRQDTKWGRVQDQDQTPYDRLAILTEEVGEVAKATLERDFMNLREELVQVAAVAIANIEQLDHQLLAGEILVP